ncbi:MAG: endonuclease/exonuclease/phosphatase family protein [Elusimicrobiota bacterium]
MGPNCKIRRILTAGILVCAVLSAGTHSRAQVVGRAATAAGSSAGAANAAAAASISAGRSQIAPPGLALPTLPSLDLSAPNFRAPATLAPIAANQAVTAVKPVLHTITPHEQGRVERRHRPRAKQAKTKKKKSSPSNLEHLGDFWKGIEDQQAPRGGLLKKFWDGASIKGSIAPKIGRGVESIGRAVAAWTPPKLSPAPERLEDIRELKVGTYNTMHLLQHPGRYVYDKAKGQLVKVKDGPYKNQAHVQQTAEAILESDLDVVVLQEIESLEHLEKFNKEYLDDSYDVFHLEGNDPVGINSAVLVKKGLPVEIEYRSHKDETWYNPVRGKEKPIFTRDLPAMIVRPRGQERPLFVLLAAHMKSKHSAKDSPEHTLDPENRNQRKVQADRMADIILKLQQEFGASVPVMLTGDFNGELTEDAFADFFRRTGMLDSFDLLANPPPPGERVTHTFHPFDGPTQYHQLDALLVTPAIQGIIKNAAVYRYHDHNGKVRPIPKTFEERKRNPSDHFPVIVTLDFPPILKAARR